jgi:hypothetical protein
LCDLYCTDLGFDVANCGGCGNRCAEGLICCSGLCVDIATDPLNCGGCGNYCPVSLLSAGDRCRNYQCR